MDHHRFAKRLKWEGEGDLERIADKLEGYSVVLGNGIVEDRVVQLKGLVHCFRIALPERSAAFDVGEEKSDDSAGKISHR